MLQKSFFRRSLISGSFKLSGLLLALVAGWFILAPPTKADTLVAWGDNTYGQVTGTPNLSAPFYAAAIPVMLNGQPVTGVKAFDGGGGHTLVVKTDGTVLGWGGNDNGQTDIPPGLSGVIAVAAGNWHSVALMSDGTVVAWGATTGGCFTNCGQSDVPVGLTGVTAISAGVVHTMALKSDGTVVAWGEQGYGFGATSVPADLSGVTAISAGAYHSLALKSDGTVVAWGWNEFHTTDVPPGLSGVKAISAGFRFSAALKEDGTVVIWGGEGNMGVPAGLSGVRAIASNGYDLQALKWDGTIVTWGANYLGSGQLPPELDNETVTAIAAGGSFTLGLIVPLDTAAPTLSPVVDPNPIFLNGTATVTSGAADETDGSGLASESCGPLDTSTVGTKSVTCTATDNAGNTNSADASYIVIYNFSGFFQPVDNSPTLNIATAGSAIPIKFSLAGNQGLGIFEASYSVETACDANEPGAVIEETVNAGGSSLSYDTSADRYNYVWKTNKAWKGKCRILVVRFIDGTDHLAKFKFK